MRIIAGKYKGKKLYEHRSIRSTRDFVKEALFNIIENHTSFEGKQVLDICAGTGAFGLEAYSRGAESITFVEPAPEVLLHNLSLFKEANFKVIQKKFEDIKTLPAYDIVFFDPPYANEALYQLAFEKLNHGTVIIEHHPKTKLKEANVYKQYGNTALSIYFY